MFKRSKEQEKKGSEKREVLHVSFLKVARFVFAIIDSSDYAYEDRYFRNYFFSDKPFTREQINRLAYMKRVGNLEFINDEMPEWSLPSAYYKGEGDEIIYAF